VWQMASPSSSGKYDTVIKSGLKLKGGDKSREVGVKAAKKKKKSQEDILTEQLQASAEQELQEQSELVKGATQGPTTAQKTFQLAREKRTNQRVNEAIQFTHRQRMDKLNAHLGSLSEHFDIPKVGPG
ncbi:FAM32A, partial [Symbiodinium microadriaticum]